MKATAEWFPAKEQGFAGGMFNIGASFGSMLSAAAHWVSRSCCSTGRRRSYWSRVRSGSSGSCCGTGSIEAPDRHPALSAEERAYISAGQETHLQGARKRPSILAIARQRNFWGIALPRFLADPTWSTLTFWLPLYLSQVRGFNLKEIALTAWLPFLAADLGCFFGGVIVAFLQRRGIGLINARRGAFTVGAILMTGMAFVGYVHSPYAALALLCLGGFAHQTLSVTSDHDVVRPFPAQRGCHRGGHGGYLW